MTRKKCGFDLAGDVFDEGVRDAEAVQPVAGVEQVFGEGWTSWGIGKVSKATVGIFTGLGKGITLIGNRDAQASDYVIGGIEIAGSADNPK